MFRFLSLGYCTFGVFFPTQKSPKFAPEGQQFCSVGAPAENQWIGGLTGVFNGDLRPWWHLYKQESHVSKETFQILVVPRSGGPW